MKVLRALYDWWWVNVEMRLGRRWCRVFGHLWDGYLPADAWGVACTKRECLRCEEEQLRPLRDDEWIVWREGV